ncbi:MAG: substrate-binding domain-containing protein [Anaerolineaceae bacterium]|nr:substrate-binding domain-containing protein [Anaerolineaceae bacterium]
MTNVHQPRPTIAFLSANIHVGASRVLWPGILDAAVSADVNLICFPGGRLHAAESGEAMRNIIYQQVDSQQLAGLVIWTSALAGAATPQEVADFHQAFHTIPLVDLAGTTGQHPIVAIDGRQGMHALLVHLIEEHGYRRIALIRGPESHPYAVERHRAFLDTLHEKGIQPDERLISPALGWNRGVEAMSVLLDERGLQPGRDFQAVVAASDLLAIGAIRLMAERGIHVPTDVAVAGFNDIEEGRLVRPPLTSVSLPFYEQGQQSVETLLALLAQDCVPESVLLNSRLLVRQSCGCPSWSEKLARTAVNTSPPTHPPRQILKQTQELLEAEIFRVIRNRGVSATWAKQLLDAFRSEVDGGGSGRFRTTLDGMLQQGTLDGDETSAWQNSISILRRELLPMLTDSQRLQAEALFGQARVVIGDAVQRALIARQLRAERQSSVLRDIGQALITTFDVEGLADVLAARLPELGIRSAYLALYDNPREPLSTSRLILAYSDNGRIPLAGNGRTFPSRQLLPPDLLPPRRFSLLVEPLYFQDEPLGIVAFEVGPTDGDIYEVLRGHISTALKGAILFQEAYEAQAAAEQANQIKTRLLANVSHELRTPLNIIIGHAQRLTDTLPAVAHKDLDQIEQSAEHQLRLINDLLDLSRAEINALDLYPMMLDPRSLIADAFSSMAKDAADDVAWQLDLPDSLPIVAADPVRLRQILLNLLSNAARFTQSGQICLGAEGTASHLHLWVADTGVGIPADVIEHIYEPFVTVGTAVHPSTGIGLGLSITRHLVALHDGYLTVESTPGEGSTFHVYLPLPGAAALAVSATPASAATPGDGALVWWASRREAPPEAVMDFTRRRQLQLHHLHPEASWETLLTAGLPAAVIWDMAKTNPEDWQLMRRLHNHPQLYQIPFVLYQQELLAEAAAGLTSLVVKPASTQALWAAIQPTAPEAVTGSVLIVDDDPRARQLTQAAVGQGLPGFVVRTAVNGAEGWLAMQADPPDLVILDLMMPEMDGFAVLERMRADERTRHIPVVILSSRQLSLADVKRLEQYSAVTLRSKDVSTPEEIAASVHQALFGDESLPVHTSALIKQAVAYLHQNYGRALTRTAIADELGLSEDYFSRTFSQELGISPWDYLNRYRVAQAKQLLQTTADSVQVIARRVGITDPAYFSRVFRRIVGESPSTYRQKYGS